MSEMRCECSSGFCTRKYCKHSNRASERGTETERVSRICQHMQLRENVINLYWWQTRCIANTNRLLSTDIAAYVHHFGMQFFVFLHAHVKTTIKFRKNILSTTYLRKLMHFENIRFSWSSKLLSHLWLIISRMRHSDSVPSRNWFIINFFVRSFRSFPSAK